MIIFKTYLESNTDLKTLFQVKEIVSKTEGINRIYEFHHIPNYVAI